MRFRDRIFVYNLFNRLTSMFRISYIIFFLTLDRYFAQTR